MRLLSPNIDNGLQAETAQIIYLIKMVFDSGIIAWNTSYQDITHESVLYRGTGNVTNISTAKEEPGVTAAAMTITISAVKPEVLALLLSEPYMNRPVYVYYTLAGQNDVVITGTPVKLFRGSIDQISGDVGTTASFTLSLKSRLADWERKRTIRYTDAEQQKLYPGDKGLEFVGQLSQKMVIWPRAAFFPDPRD